MKRWIPLVMLAGIIHGWACPAAWSQGFLQRLQSQLRNAEPPATRDSPSAPPGYLGIVGDDSPTGNGVLIATLRPGSPAAAAGLRVADRIVSLDDRPVRDVEQLAEMLESARAGQKLAIEVVRRGERQIYPVTLTARPAEPAVNSRVSPASADEAVPETGDVLVDVPALGVVVGRVSADVARQLPAKEQRGAQIEEIRPGSPADQFGLPLRGVIVSVDGRRIAEPDDLAVALAEVRGGDVVELSYYDGQQLQRKRIRVVPDPNAGVPNRSDSAPLEGLLGEGGRRPALGRIGRLLDQLTEPQPGAPAERPGVLPTPTRPGNAVPEPREPPRPGSNVLPEAESELASVAQLQRQVEALQRQLAAMQKRLEKLEGQLSQGDSAIPPPPPEPQEK